MTSVVQNTVTALDAAAKTLYKDGNFEEVVYADRPLLALLNKFEGFGGRDMPLVLLYGNTQAVSYDFSTAQNLAGAASGTGATQAGGIKLEDFVLTRSKTYSIFTLDGEAIEAIRGDNTAFLASLKSVMDAAIRALSDELETSLFRKRGAGIAQVKDVTSGTIASGIDSTNKFFCVDPDESCLFEVGMALNGFAAAAAAYDSDETTGICTSSTTLDVGYVKRVDRANGYIYGCIADGTATSWDASGMLYGTAHGGPLTAYDWLVRAGDNTYASLTRKPAGLQEWLPLTVSTSDSFFGVNRSVDSRLSGIPIDGSSDSVEDALLDLQSMICREGGSPKVIAVHNLQYRKLIKQLGARKQYVQMNAKSGDGIFANIGFRGVTLDGDKGDVSVVAMNKCPIRHGFALTPSSMTLNTLGPAVHFTEYDGNKILRLSDADGVEGRLVFRGNLGCRAPIWNGRVKLAV